MESTNASAAPMETTEATQTASAPTGTLLFDEKRWLRQVQEDYESGQPKTVDVDDALPAIFDVPEALLSSNPQAYAPHMFAIGPYHKRRQEVYKMEHRKAAAVRQDLKGLTCEDLAQHFTALEGKIRAHYHRYLDYNEQGALAWMMAIDACFVLIFLRKHYSRGEATVDKPLEKAWFKNAVLRDIVMLENQIPLCLLVEIVKKERPSSPTSEIVRIEERLGPLKTFIIEVSPFKVTENLAEKLWPLLSSLERQHHLLAILYGAVAPKWEDQPKEPRGVKVEYRHSNSARMAMECQIDSKESNSTTKTMENRPSSLVKWFTAKYGWSKRPPATASLEELPSATDLHTVGVEFVATSMGIEGISFDPESRVFHLPAIYLDDNTEVIMRNLVAYEATAVDGPLSFARFTELMSAVIRTEQDLKLLRESEIIKGELLGNREALDLWNGVSRSVRATKVPQLDEQIIAVKEFYGSWRVRARRFLRRSAYEDSWKLLLLLVATLLLLTNGLQAYCSVYTCARHSG